MDLIEEAKHDLNNAVNDKDGDSKRLNLHFAEVEALISIAESLKKIADCTEHEVAAFHVVTHEGLGI